jgi:DNA-damage-inducible protein D
VKGEKNMNSNIKEYNIQQFEDIKHIDENGNEYWMSRELGKILEYSEYRKFLPSIKKAFISCKKSGQNVENHFALMDAMVNIGSKAKRKLKDYRLTRYACYLIVQNSDSSKPVVALGQTYFAIQTRKMEIIELNNISEEEKRLTSRKRIRKSNNLLNKTALKSGVKNFDKFHNSGYKGLYNGETANDIAKRKNLRYNEEILDNMCSGELIANEFRINLTKEALENKNINNEHDANIEHFNIGKSVRKVIEDNGGTLPENYPTPKKSIKELNKINKLKK